MPSYRIPSARRPTRISDLTMDAWALKRSSQISIVFISRTGWTRKGVPLESLLLFEASLITRWSRSGPVSHGYHHPRPTPFSTRVSWWTRRVGAKWFSLGNPHWQIKPPLTPWISWNLPYSKSANATISWRKQVKRSEASKSFGLFQSCSKKVLLSESQLQQNPHNEAIRHILSNAQTGLVDTMQ